jgi:hypothetical protein
VRERRTGRTNHQRRRRGVRSVRSVDSTLDVNKIDLSLILERVVLGLLAGLLGGSEGF